MKKLLVYGKTTYQKTTLALTLATGIIAIRDEKVLLVTNNKFYKKDLAFYEYAKNMDVCYMATPKLMDDAQYDHILYDVEEWLDTSVLEGEQKSHQLIYVTQDLPSVLYTEELLPKIQGEVMLSLNEWNEESKISEKYLIKKLGAIRSIDTICSLSYDEKDTGKLIDFGHNEAIRIKKMSRLYKSFVYDMVNYYLKDGDHHKIRKLNMKKMERANK